MRKTKRLHFHPQIKIITLMLLFFSLLNTVYALETNLTAKGGDEITDVTIAATITSAAYSLFCPVTNALSLFATQTQEAERKSLCNAIPKVEFDKETERVIQKKYLDLQENQNLTRDTLELDEVIYFQKRTRWLERINESFGYTVSLLLLITILVELVGGFAFLWLATFVFLDVIPSMFFKFRDSLTQMFKRGFS